MITIVRSLISPRFLWACLCETIFHGILFHRDFIFYRKQKLMTPFAAVSVPTLLCIQAVSLVNFVSSSCTKTAENGFLSHLLCVKTKKEKKKEHIHLENENHEKCQDEILEACPLFLELLPPTHPFFLVSGI